MNLAFPALCILLLVLPGILFRRTYSRGALFFSTRRGQTSAVTKYPTSNLPLTEEIALGLVAAIMLHVIWLTLAALIGDLWHLDMAPDYPKIFYILYGGLNVSEKFYETVLNYLADQHAPLTLYFLSLYFFSALAGRLSLWLVRWHKLDHRWMFLRMEDHWFYFLYGEIFRFSEFREFLPDIPPISGTYISVVVNHNGADVLYKGFLWDFYLDKAGNLDRLLMHNVIRCKFYPADPTEAKGPTNTTADQKPMELMKPESKRSQIVHRSWVFERVSSQIFTVKYADCKTLACTYFCIEEIPIPSKIEAGSKSQIAPFVHAPDATT